MPVYQVSRIALNSMGSEKCSSSLSSDWARAAGKMLHCGSSAGSSSVSVDCKGDREISTGTRQDTHSYLEVGEQVGRMLDQCDSDGLNR